MVKIGEKIIELTKGFCVLILVHILIFDSTEARNSGDDIIMTKGKLIVRGGKGRGNLIIDSGSKSSAYPMMPMIPLMGHHYNLFPYYPMHHGQHHQHQPPPIMIHPIYIEDHSAMHEQKDQHQQYEHHEPPQEYHHEEVKYHEQPEHEFHEQPEQFEIHQDEPQEMPVEHNYDQEMHQQPEEESHTSGYETNPKISVMMHQSALEPNYQQVAQMQVFPGVSQIQNLNKDQPLINDRPYETKSSNQDNLSSAVQKDKENSSGEKSSANHPLAAIIRPLFKRNNKKTKNNVNENQSKEP